MVNSSVLGVRRKAAREAKPARSGISPPTALLFSVVCEGDVIEDMLQVAVSGAMPRAKSNRLFIYLVLCSLLQCPQLLPHLCQRRRCKWSVVGVLSRWDVSL